MIHQNNPKNTLQVIEWESFSLDHIKPVVGGDETKAQKIFDEFKDFASYEKNRFFLSTDKKGKALKAQNYVGLIQTKSGFCLEILPKIYDKGSMSEEKLRNSKELLIKMLKTLKNFPAKTSNLSNLRISKPPILEIFVQMFLNELVSLIKKGIKRDYYPIEKNRFYLKGKLLFSHHIKHNLTHQERFYSSSDEYTADMPQNRLIKSTLDLFSMPLSATTQNLLQECRFIFDDIPSSKNIDKDLTFCHTNKSLKHYQCILAWCKVFLKRQNFTSYAGNTIAMAFLFDMNHLFESYITHHLKCYCQDHWGIKAQDKSKYLLENNQCKLIPDIVGTHNNDNKKTFILDTKWKIIKDANIASSDIYQIWAYASKYKSEKVILIYPKIGQCEEIQKSNFKPEFFKCTLEIILIDLEQEMKDQIKRIFQELSN